MSTLSQFIGGNEWPYIELANDNPTALNWNDQRPYFSWNSTGASITLTGTRPKLTFNSPRGSDVLVAGNVSSIYPNAADTIRGNCHIALDGTTCRLILCEQTSTTLKYIRGLSFGLVNTSQGVYITGASADANLLTDLDVTLDFNTSGSFYHSYDTTGTHTPNLANVTLRVGQIRTISSSVFQLLNCALTAQSVENILVAFDRANYRSTLMGNMFINLSGGTSSGAGALTAAAAAARTSLLAKGIGGITLNP